MKKSPKSWFDKIFIRDIYITKRGFFYFLIAIIFYLNSFIFTLFSFVTFTPMEFNFTLGVVFMISTLMILSIGGLIVDRFKNRIRLALISSIGQIIGLILFSISPVIELIGIIGFSIIIFFSGLFIINLLTIITHETTILNRARILGYLFFISFIISFLIIIFTDLLCIFLNFNNLVIIIIIQTAFFIIMFDIIKNYSYIETNERLKSDFQLKDILNKQHVFGYLTAFLVLGFILGNAFPIGANVFIEPSLFLITILFFFILCGVLFDNQGRKWSFVGGIFILSTIIIFADIFGDYYLSLFFGVSIPLVVIGLFTFIGDNTTERNTLKYRGRISSLFVLSTFVGILFGLLVKSLLTQLFLSYPHIYWLPFFMAGVDSFLLIGLLVWIMPLPEILSSKESDWATTLRSVYIFNKDSLCLYSKIFKSEESSKLSEDLITGGLTGVLALISEITNEKKNLKIIDKDRVKIYFSYGKHIIVALTSGSSKYLPVLNKKLFVFTKVFEKKFDFELTHFSGKTNIFLNETGPLIKKYLR